MAEPSKFDIKTFNRHRPAAVYQISLRMEFLPQQCAANSVGAANGFFGLLVNTLMAAHCALSSNDRWPKDYGPTALENGNQNHKIENFRNEN